MTSRKSTGKPAGQNLTIDVSRSRPIRRRPAGATTAADSESSQKRCYRYTYTTGPFSLPLKTHSIDWGILNNDSSTQTVRVTVFKCWLGAVKTAEPPGPFEVTMNPGETTHNANGATGGFFYEIQVECDSQLVFPYASTWSAAIADPIPGSVVKSAEFIRSLP